MPPPKAKKARKEHAQHPINRRGRRRLSAVNDEEEPELNGLDQGVGRHRHHRSSISMDEPTSYVRQHLRHRESPLLRQHPTHFSKAKPFESFGEWLAQDDPLEEEKVVAASAENPTAEARVRVLIAKATEDDGPLSDARCTRLSLREFAEPQTKYGHTDFIATQAVYFRKLLKDERREHKKRAKEIARSCALAIATDDKWTFLRAARAPEEIWQEQYDQQLKRYRQIVKDIHRMWDLVADEVVKIRQAEFEKEQEKQGTKALDEMLVQSTHLLHRHRREGSETTSGPFSRNESVALEDDSHMGSDDQSANSSDDENLTDSSDEDSEEGQDADDDANLTVEQLREKYAKLASQNPSDQEDDEDEEELEEDDEGDGQSDQEDEKHQRPLDVEDFPDSAGTPGYDSASVMEAHTDHDDATEGAVTGYGTEDDQSDEEQEQDLQRYKEIELDEVDAALLDDSDEDSTDMSEGETDEDDESVEESDEGTDVGLAGFYLSKRDISAAHQDESEAEDEQDVDMAEATPATSPEPDTKTTSTSPHSEHNSVRRPPPEPLQLDANGGTLPSSEKASDQEHSAVSTPHPEEDGSSTPSTSIVPATPSAIKTEVSPLLRGDLREYQHKGVDWLVNLAINGGNGILADEMGLGKTIQTIALLAYLATHRRDWGPHLVVVPTSVMLNWEMEFKKWCPAFRILTYYGDIAERKRKRQGWTNDDVWNVCITSYNIILQDAQVFKRRGWHYLVLDEAHNIKNFQSQRWQTLLTFRTNSRLLLTGTPLQNNLQELWSLLYFLMPTETDNLRGFADLDKFLNSMKRPADQILDQGLQQLDAEAQARVSKLHSVLRPFLLRRLKSEVEKQMPGKYEHVIYCRLSKRQRQLYDEFMGRDQTQKTLAKGDYLSVINCLMSLRKVCNHPDLFETRQIVTSLAMKTSVVATYDTKELLVRKRLLASEEIDLDFVGLRPTAHENVHKGHLARFEKLQTAKRLEKLVKRETQKLEAIQEQQGHDTESVLTRMKFEAQRNVVQDLRRQTNQLKRVISRKPIYGADLVEFVTMPKRFDPPTPTRKKPNYSHGDWFLDRCNLLDELFPTVQQVSARNKSLVTKFSCVTPAVVAEDVLTATLTPTGAEVVRLANSSAQGNDPYHEARIRQSIAFPDKRLLQYDCGKLQALDGLLRQLQSGGHRCLIFTQMTKVLDILEQFLNIHGHRYLRLDGSTKVEQRQILTDRFNNDERILAFILSSRSGGLGINLTGADTVIFYDMDWNPAMDKQCQDRCHRIGQTRDVHIYRFVSEYTIEANILRKSNQKRLLDDVFIQKGEFTTDMFQRVTYRDALDGIKDAEERGDGVAGQAVDRFMGAIASADRLTVLQDLERNEDKEDTDAAKAAAKEISLGDDIDFSETALVSQDAAAANPAAALDAAVEGQAVGDEVPHLDEYLLRRKLDEIRHVVVRPKTSRQKLKARKKGPDWKSRR